MLLNFSVQMGTSVSKMAWSPLTAGDSFPPKCPSRLGFFDFCWITLEITLFGQFCSRHLVLYYRFLRVLNEFKPDRVNCGLDDISYGAENVPISWVNSVDKGIPDYVEYSTSRFVSLHLNPTILGSGPRW